MGPSGSGFCGMSRRCIGDRGEANERGVGGASVGVAGFSGGRGMLWVPVVEIEGLGVVGRRGFVEGDGLVVGEEAVANGGAVFGGFTVVVEEVEFVFLVLVLGFVNWGLRRHFYVLFFLLSLFSFTITH